MTSKHILAEGCQRQHCLHLAPQANCKVLAYALGHLLLKRFDMTKLRNGRDVWLVALACASTQLFAVQSATEENLATQTSAAVLQPMDIFDLEWASAPSISPDGSQIVFVRNRLDVMKDARRSTLWLMRRDGAMLEPLTTGERNDAAPQFSPDGKRIAFLSGGQIYIRYLGTGRELQVTHVVQPVQQFAFAPDGKTLAFSMRVPASMTKPAALPTPPEGAKWAEPVAVIDRLSYRADGEGIFTPYFSHVFMVPAIGGSARQISVGNFNYGGFAFADKRTLIVSANREADAEMQPLQSDLFELSVSAAPSTLKKLTQRIGPDEEPSVSADGRFVAYVGFSDREQFYQVRVLSVLDRSTGVSTALTEALDRDVVAPMFSGDGKQIYFQYDDQGVTKVARIARSGGKVQTLANDLGGADIGRPYGAGSMSISRAGDVAYTQNNPQRPAEVALMAQGKDRSTVLTDLNSALAASGKLQPVQSLWVKSGFDQRPIQAWIMRPPGFDAAKKYPLLLEIHGGPVQNYGPRFAAETQLYAAQGYIVVYANPRGSDSYGAEFGNLIHHDYPNHDFDDLMSVTDAVIAQSSVAASVDTRNLFVTGGSGGGVLTAWIVGHTDRFRAAVVAKPVINWISFVLTSDSTNMYSRYWFPGVPWEHAAHYLKRSPLMSVGNVKTPTMLITGEADQRTPISESEQYFTALKLRNVPTQLVRIPGASHSINARPSNLLAQVLNTAAWFERFRVK
jgi:dipeptidyl aminopeptidase/acylaminoacyl peptidase